MQEDIFFIIQARVDSTRLPGKILLPFYKGRSILELLIEKLQRIESAKIVIATSVNPGNEAVEEFAKSKNILCYRGDENDVLMRFIECAEKYGASHIIRVCADNPFLELESICKLVEKAKEVSCDYISFDIFGKPSIQTHYGFWAEYVRLSALKKIKEMTDEPFFHEHVTNYIYMHPQFFTICWLPGPKELRGYERIRLTIDTKADFENGQKIYEDLVARTSYPTIQDILSYLDDNPYYYDLMDAQIKNNTK